MRLRSHFLVMILAIFTTVMPLDEFALAKAEEATTENKDISKPPAVEPASPQTLDELAAAGVQCYQLYAESPLLQVSFAGDAKPSGEAPMALLAKIAEQIYSLDLASLQVSDQGLAVLSQLKNLTQLHLEKSQVTDSGLAPLTQLHRLQYLNLYGTSISDAGLVHLRELKQLKKLYLWKTAVSYEAAMALEKQIPGLRVNLGYDHPGVVRKRLTDALERVQKETQEHSVQESRLQQELESARQANQATQKRLKEIQNELDSLDGKKSAPAVENKAAAAATGKEPEPKQEPEPEKEPEPKKED
jgi:hypothetical protein